MRKSALYISILLSALLTMLSACVGVDLCTEEEHPHTSELQISYSTDTIKTFVIANRPYMTCKYLFGWFPMENVGYELGSLPPEPVDSMPPHFDADSLRWFMDEETTSAKAKAQKLRKGKYSMMTISAFQTMHFDSLDVFLRNSDASADIIGIHYDTWHRPEEVDSAFVDWVNMNTQYPYAKDEGVIYFDEQIADAETGEPVIVNFTPTPLSQHLTFELSLARNNEELVLDSIQAEISGVITSKKIRTGYLDMVGEHTAKMIFPMRATLQNDGLTYSCHGEVNVLGLMGPASADMQTGPGIMHLAAYTHRINSRGETECRTYLWGINLYSTLYEHPVTLRTFDMEHHVMTNPYETLQLPFDLKMKIEDYNNQDDIYHWEDDRPDHVEVEY